MLNLLPVANDNALVPHNGLRARRLRRKVSIWIESLMLVSGLILVAFYAAAKSESALDSRASLRAFDDLQRMNSSPAEAAVSRGEELETATGPARGRQIALRKSQAGWSGVPLAVLHIPKLGLSVPLLDGTDGLTLNHGVGRIAGTARPGELGNLGIAGHRDGFFRGLKDINIGDVIELKQLERYDTYVVSQIQIVSPRDVAVLRVTAVPSITLVTCYPFDFVGNAPKRFVVTASRVPRLQAE